MFVDYSTSQEILNKSENNKIANKILMYSGSAESTDLALNKLKELKIDESKYSIEKDSNVFEESLESVSGIKHIIKVMTYSIMLGGMIVLSLILVLGSFILALTSGCISGCFLNFCVLKIY